MSARLEILFLAHRVPFPLNRGDRIRSYHLLKHLAERADVSLATLADEPLEPGTLDAMRSICSRVAVEPLGKSRWLRAMASVAVGRSATEGLFRSPRLSQAICRWSRETRWDAIVVFCSSMVQYLDLPALAGVPTVVDLCDVDSQKFLDYAANTRGLKRHLYRLEARRLRSVERSLPSRVEAITLVSQAEADLYRSFCPNDRTRAIAMGVDLDFYQPAPDGRPGRCVFVGAMDYRPNVEGVVWFCEHIWPQVTASRPDAKFAIVGRNPVPAVRRLASIPGVEVVGPVSDVRPHLADAQVAVIPLLIARGIQNKVLEAMAMAKPVIASPQALAGLDVEPALHLLQASTAADWVEQITCLLANPSLRVTLARHARQLVEQRYCWQNCLSSFPIASFSLEQRSTPTSVRSNSSPAPPSVVCGH
jgi:sugar transferase (PEP-CTERM/EpsH1 system associated)